MATYVFENMSQDQANALQVGDIIAFSTQSATASNIVVTPPAPTDTVQLTKLTVGAKTLSFDAGTISDVSSAGGLAFFDGSSLHFGDNASDTNATLFTGSTTTNGSDTIYLFGGAADTVDAGTGNDNVFGGEGSDTILGNAGNDHLYGYGLTGDPTGDLADSINGGSGGDYINGMAGDDSIDGGTGSDRLRGGGGNDTILGNDGNDSINGEKGNDVIDGGLDDDSIRGGQGTDSLSGGAGSDLLLGDLGNDTLNGNAGVDFLNGGDGADRFVFTSATVVAGLVTVASGSAPDVTGTTYNGVETVQDYVDGTDKLQISGFTPGTGDVLYQGAGVTLTSIADARVYAQQLLDNHAGTSDIASIKIGSDTYLFYDSTNGGVTATPGQIDSVIKLQGIADATVVTNADFV